MGHNETHRSPLGEIVTDLNCAGVRAAITAQRLDVWPGARSMESWHEKEDIRMSAWDFEVGPEDKVEPEKGTAEEKVEGKPEEKVEQSESPREAEQEKHRDKRARRDPMGVAGPRQLEQGEIVKGVVVATTEDGVLVDVGGKSEGLIPRYEFANQSEMPTQDEEVEVAVVRIEGQDGMPILSKRSADYERVWVRILSAQESGEVLDAMVMDRVKGGLRVDLGVPGFVPASHVATRDVRNLDRFVGRSLRLKVLEADRRSKKVVLSHRLVVEEERKQRREQTMAQLREGIVCEGKVRSLTKYGAFVDLGGVDGLLHISEMAWGRVEDPSDVMQVGDTVRVMVLDIDRERDRISLGRRQILPDPWKEAAKSIRVGSLVKAKITRVVRTGAFAELGDLGIEGFIPVSEVSERRVGDASEVVSEGEEVTLKVLKIRPEARRMTLSLREAEQEKERQEYRQYIAAQDKAKVTLGDRFGEVLGAVAEHARQDEEKATGEETAPAEVEEAQDEAKEMAEEVTGEEAVGAEAAVAVEEGAIETQAEEAGEQVAEEASEERAEEAEDEAVTQQAPAENEVEGEEETADDEEDADQASAEAQE